MHITEIKKKVAEIEAVKGDDEAAHAKEDSLWFDFIEYVSLTADEDLAEKATAVMHTQEIDFRRWCA